MSADEPGQFTDLIDEALAQLAGVVDDAGCGGRDGHVRSSANPSATLKGGR